MIDTHTHLYAEQFDTDLPAVIQRAEAAGVTHFVLPAIDSATHEKMLTLAAQHPGKMYAMMGLHPVDVKAETWEMELEMVRDYLDKYRFVAVGEIGIDLHWHPETLELQQEAFRRQIRMALDRDLPVVLHTRESFAETFSVLDEFNDPKLRGILHCFSGNLEQAREAVSKKFLLGIGGVVTFKNGKIDQFLNEIPLEYLVLETDSPYLAPAPYRGKRNESSYLPLICNRIAEIYGITPEQVDRKTTQNAKQLFGIQ